MGCDIHYVVERKVSGKWVGLFSHHPRNAEAAKRNYAAFAELASIRGKSSKGRYAKFIPWDISDLALLLTSQDSTNGHSHSHLSMREFCQAYLDADEIMKKENYPGQSVPEHHLDCPWATLFGIYIEDECGDGTLDDYRVVFWFDN